MSARFSALRLNENDGQLLPDSAKLHARLAAWLQDGSEHIEKQSKENRYWDRSAPAVFSVFVASLITLLVLSYVGVPIVIGNSVF